MDPATISSILDMGGIAALAGFLMWLNAKTQRRLDEMFESYQESIKDQETAHSRSEELIRNRYDTIIARHEGQRQAIYDEIVRKVDAQGRVMEDLHLIARGKPPRIDDPCMTIKDF
jgi:hypothetical protein